MTRLADLNARIKAYQAGESIPEPFADPMTALIAAVRDIQILVEHGESIDHGPALENLGKALVTATKSHGNDLIKAINGISIKVEAPQVSVEAPAVTVNPEFEVTLPANESKPFSIAFERNDRDVLIAAHVTDYQPKPKPESRVVME